MLQELLDLIQDAQDAVDARYLCEHLEVSPSTLQAMLDILVRKGRITAEILSGANTCATSCGDCPALQECFLPDQAGEIIYKLVNRS